MSIQHSRDRSRLESATPHVTSPLVTIMNTSSSVGSFSAKETQAAVGGDELTQQPLHVGVVAVQLDACSCGRSRARRGPWGRCG